MHYKQVKILMADPNQRTATVKNQDITGASVACWKKNENKLKTLKLILEKKWRT